ncbi:putative membrane protein [Halobacteriovorax marinus SJ]|uniref:Membrane protein n=1 Tax=Halobacteriovorax marinus (strain ATCC BAA-682 / DSM 15412 / SJ) TaxID=862908 RepID=E1X3W5_HALMS|nr:hypothetical protein [Halobacteriovorax marinus]CBW25305.1 putative membrane protein [Halobacteriovorax marinus SJ]
MFEKLINSDSKELFKKLLIFSIGFHILAVIFSEGFHRPDEHLGMLRYVFVKLGQYPIDELSWEYPVKIRNWVQPGLYYFLLKPFYTLGLTNPFILTFILRLVTSAFSFYTLYRFSIFSKSFLKSTQSQNFANILFYGLWFFPFIHARTTAENFGMNVFAIALMLLVEKSHIQNVREAKATLLNKKSSIPVLQSIVGGFLLGMSVNFRIPLAPMPFFLILWLYLFGDIKLKSILLILSGTLISILFTIGFDTWGYGEITYSTWNYLYQEFTRNVSSGFGTSPWYYYISKTFSKGVPPFSIAIILAFLTLWLKYPKNILTWITLPVFALHSAIGHKELRYIFPLTIFIPIVCAFIFEKYSHYLNAKWLKKVFSLCIVVNLIFLFISSLKPAYTPIDIYKFLYKKSDRINTLYTYKNHQRDVLKIYLKNNIKFITLNSDEETEKAILSEKETWFLVEKISDFNFFEMKSCVQEFSTYPNWFTNMFKKVLKRSKAWTIYRCLNE